jgi:MFS family permease
MAQTTLSLLGKSLGLSGAAIGAVAAGSNLVGIATMVLITAHLATSAARQAVLASLALVAGSLAFFLMPWQIALYTGAVLLGIAGGLALPSAATAVSHGASPAAGPDQFVDHHQSRVARARALATLGLVLSISLAVGPLYESLVLTATDENLRAAYVAFLPVAVVGGAAIWARRQPTPDAKSLSISFRESVAGLVSLFHNRRWRLAICGQAIYMLPFAVVIVFAGLLAESLYHASASTTEIGIALFFIVSLVCRATLTRRPAVDHRVTLFGLCIAATLLGLALLATGVNVGLFLLALAVLGAPHGLIYPLALGLVADSIPGHELPRANAGFQAMSNAINVAAPLALGLVLDHFGARVMLLVAAIAVTPIIGLLWRLRDAG